MKVKTLLKNYKTISNSKNLFNFQKKFIAQGATYQTNQSNVKLRGKFLKSTRPDMPTLVFFPEILEEAESYEKFFADKNHGILDYRNVWILNPRNMGNSDHHDSFCFNDMAEDLKNFLDEKKLSIVTVGGHGWGAKIACAFSTLYLERTSGVMCIEGGPIDHSYFQVWNDIRNNIKKANHFANTSTSVGEVIRKLDKEIKHKRWNKIIKNNLIDQGSSVSWKCNMKELSKLCNQQMSVLTRWNGQYGLFPGRAFVQFASESNHIYLATNTIPIYCFFPKLEGRFPSISLNMILTENDDDSKIINYSFQILFHK